MAESFSDEVGYRVVDAGQMTYAQWEVESNRLARGLVDRGVTKGDRVALYLRAEEALRFMVAYSAIHKAGAVAVPTNIRLTDSELERLLGHAEVKMMLTDDGLSSAATRVASALPTVAHVLTAPPATGDGPAGTAPWSWGDNGGDDESAFQVALGPEDMA